MRSGLHSRTRAPYVAAGGLRAARRFSWDCGRRSVHIRTWGWVLRDELSAGGRCADSIRCRSFRPLRLNGGQITDTKRTNYGRQTDELRTAPPRTHNGHIIDGLRTRNGRHTGMRWAWNGLHTDAARAANGLGTGKIRTSDVREERGGVFAAAFSRLSVRASDVGRSRYGRMADKPRACDVRARDRFGTAHGLCTGGVRLRFAAGALCVRASDG